jgi:hypothetical protein
MIEKQLMKRHPHNIMTTMTPKNVVRNPSSSISNNNAWQRRVNRETRSQLKALIREERN